MSATTTQPSVLATRRGKLTLLLLCAVAFLDFVDAPILNVALPSIRHALHFSVQGLQWVPSAYLLTYGGFMLLGGRAADLFGRRRILLAGVVVLGVSSLVGGFAQTSGVLVGARHTPVHAHLPVHRAGRVGFRLDVGQDAVPRPVAPPAVEPV